jgi:hypothetical protein
MRCQQTNLLSVVVVLAGESNRLLIKNYITNKSADNDIKKTYANSQTGILSADLRKLAQILLYLSANICVICGQMYFVFFCVFLRLLRDAFFYFPQGFAGDPLSGLQKEH